MTDKLGTRRLQEEQKALRDRLVGHAPADVGEKHYTARALATLRDAVETIKLDLRTGEVIALPVRAVANAPSAPQTVIHTAESTAGLPRPAVSGEGIANDSERRGRDSNPRMTVLQTVA
jgi:hypothetical protein